MNFHFFHDNKADLQKFLAPASKVSIVLDPPFGGRPELIANTVKQIRDLVGKDVNFSIFWIYPYFLEKKLQQVIYFPFLTCRIYTEY